MKNRKARLLPRIAEGGLGALAITEPTAGSDATGMKTTFTPDGDDIVVSGSKIFISNGDVADLYLLFGKWSQFENPEAGDLGARPRKGGGRLQRCLEKSGRWGTNAFVDLRIGLRRSARSAPANLDLASQERA